MNEENIRKYAKLMKELELTGLEVTEDDQVVRLERMPAATVPAVVPVQASSAAPETDQEDHSGLGQVCSPMVGVFYAAPAENAPPFVNVGDPVRKGDTLCIIEAMKLMNEITADKDGTITEVCVTNGQVVEYGTVLFRIGG